MKNGRERSIDVSVSLSENEKRKGELASPVEASDSSSGCLVDQEGHTEPTDEHNGGLDLTFISIQEALCDWITQNKGADDDSVFDKHLASFEEDGMS